VVPTIHAQREIQKTLSSAGVNQLVNLLTTQSPVPILSAM
ncbi:hypothetical protein Tco_1281231, partial [Tanacetum coccineum]